MEPVTAALPAVAGTPGVTQGRYGDNGNLELVMPAVDDGLWVLWFNSDDVERRTGAAVRHWSGALHFGAGRRRAAAVSQVRSGPDFLEVTALGDAGADRYYWTPDDGFVPGGVLEPGARNCSAIVQDDAGVFHVLVVAAAGETFRFRASSDDYPWLHWEREALGLPADEVAVAVEAGEVTGVARVGTAVRAFPLAAPESVDSNLPGHWSAASAVSGSGRLVVGTDLAGHPQLAVRDEAGWRRPVVIFPDLVVDVVAATLSTLDGGRMDLVLRTGTELRHAWCELARADQPESWHGGEAIRSSVWTASGAPVHRR